MTSNRTEEQINAEISQHEELIKQLIEERKQIRRERMFACPKCCESSPVREWVLVQEYCYVPPRGCTEGDYHVFSEYRVHCPLCDGVGRVYKSGKYATREQDETYNFIKHNEDLFKENLKYYARYNKNEGYTLDQLREEERKREYDW